jgi:hypothetical protein
MWRETVLRFTRRDEIVCARRLRNSIGECSVVIIVYLSGRFYIFGFIVAKYFCGCFWVLVNIDSAFGLNVNIYLISYTILSITKTPSTIGRIFTWKLCKNLRIRGCNNIASVSIDKVTKTLPITVLCTWL